MTNPCAPLLPPWARSQIPSRGPWSKSLIRTSHSPLRADKDPWTPPSDTLDGEGCTYVLVPAPSQSKPSKVAILVFVSLLFPPSSLPLPFLPSQPSLVLRSWFFSS